MIKQKRGAKPSMNTNTLRSESDAGSVGSRDYPGAALERFEPGAQTFPTMRHQGRSLAFKEKWMQDATAVEVLELMEAYSVSIGQHWTFTRSWVQKQTVGKGVGSVANTETDGERAETSRMETLRNICGWATP